MAKKSNNKKLSQLLNETQPKVHLNIEDEETIPFTGYLVTPLVGRIWANSDGTASIESLGTRLNGLTAYKTVVNGVERVVDLKNMDEAIEFVNLLLDMGENGGK